MSNKLTKDEAMRLVSEMNQALESEKNNQFSSYIAGDNFSKIPRKFRQYNLEEFDEAEDEALLLLTTETKKITIGEEESAHQPRFALKQLKSLTDTQAETLGNYAGSLDVGITAISELSAKSLAERSRDVLTFNELEELDENTANIFSKSKCKHLYLATRELSNESAEALSNYDGYLHLLNLKNLSESVAESLSKHQGGLEVGKFHTIPEMKGRFGRNPATGEKVKIPDRPAKYLGDPLSEKSLEYLSKYNGRELSIWNKWDESTLKLFTNYDGDLYLGVSKWNAIYLSNDAISSGAPELTDDVIEIIANKSGINKIELCIEELSNTAAESLSEFQGKELSLPGVEKLSDDAAEFLSQYEGHLSLNNLTDLSAFAVTSLRGLENRVQNYTFFPENG